MSQLAVESAGTVSKTKSVLPFKIDQAEANAWLSGQSNALIFVSRSCDSCKSSTPHIERFFGQFPTARRGSLDASNATPELKSFLTDLGIENYPSILIRHDGKTLVFSGPFTMGKLMQYALDLDIREKLECSPHNSVQRVTEQLNARQTILGYLSNLNLLADSPLSNLEALRSRLMNVANRENIAAIDPTEARKIIEGVSEISDYIDKHLPYRSDAYSLTEQSVAAITKQTLLHKIKRGVPISEFELEAYLRNNDPQLMTAGSKHSSRFAKNDPETPVGEATGKLLNTLNNARGSQTFKDSYRPTIQLAKTLRPDSVVAYIGAGTDTLRANFILDQIGKSGKLYVEDLIPVETLAKTMVSLTKQFANHVEFVRGTDVQTNLPPNSLDVAYVRDTFHHFESPVAMLENIHARLKSGGLLVIEESSYPGDVYDTALTQGIEHAQNPKQVIYRALQSNFRLKEAKALHQGGYILTFEKQ